MFRIVLAGEGGWQVLPFSSACRLEAQQKALLKQQLEFLSSAPFGDSPLFRMGLKVHT